MAAGRSSCVVGFVDAIDRGLASLALLVASSGHAEDYEEHIGDLRELVGDLRDLLDNRATGEHPRLRQPRETPSDPEAAMPMDLLPTSPPIVERRRHRCRRDEDR